MNKEIIIIDYGTASVSIHSVPEHLQNAEMHEIEEHFQIDTSASDYMVCEQIVIDDYRNK